MKYLVVVEHGKGGTVPSPASEGEVIDVDAA